MENSIRSFVVIIVEVNGKSGHPTECLSHFGFIQRKFRLPYFPGFHPAASSSALTLRANP